MKPEVSIVIPSYNSMPYFSRCVSSIVAQKLISIEVILVDDSSDDGTIAYAEKHLDVHANILCKIHKRGKGLGQATARNEGIKLSQSEYIVFLDSDDKLHSPLTLRNWVDRAKHKNVDLAIGQYITEDDKGSVSVGRKVPLYTGEDDICNISSHPYLANVSSCWQILYRKDFLIENDVKFSDRLRQREDRPFFLNALCRTNRILIISDIVIDHLIHPNSSFKKINLDQFRQYIIHMEIVRATILKDGYLNTTGYEFHKACLILCLKNLFNYWNKYISAMWYDEDHRDDINYLLSLHNCKNKGMDLYKTSYISFDKYIDREVVVNRKCDFLLLLIQNNLLDSAVKSIEVKGLNSSEFEFLSDKFSSEKNAEVLNYVAIFTPNELLPKTLPYYNKKRSNTLNEIDLVVHCGTTKTGTSHLQGMFGFNRFNALEQGIYYPIFGHVQERGARRFRSPGHAHIVQCIENSNATSLSYFKNDILSIERPIKSVVLCAENILSPRFWQKSEILQKIAKTFQFKSISFYGLYRNFPDWCYSSYVEMCSNPRNNFIMTLPEYIDHLSWQGLFLRDDISVSLSEASISGDSAYRSYDSILEKNNIVSDFCEFAKITNIKFKSISDQFSNISTSQAKSACVLALKRAKFNANIIENSIIEFEMLGGKYDDIRIINKENLESLEDDVVNVRHSRDVSNAIYHHLYKDCPADYLRWQSLVPNDLKLIIFDKLGKNYY